MKRPLRTLFYGMTHEHAPGKLETLKRLPGVFDVVAVVDDRKVATPHFQNETTQPDGFRVVTPEEAFAIPGIRSALPLSRSPTPT